MGKLVAVLFWLGLLITAFCAWVSHVIACIKAGLWILLIVGIFVPPIGWLHGIALWFGWITW